MSDIDKLIDAADESYYNGNLSTLQLSDDMYDLLREFRSPEVASSFGYVGRTDQPTAAPPKALDTPHPAGFKDILGSITRKYVGLSEFTQFIEKQPQFLEMMISPKIDGASVLVVVNKNKILAVTRGKDGRGMNVTRCLTRSVRKAFMKMIAVENCDEMAFRVEVCFSDKDLQKLNNHMINIGKTHYVNPRVAASGTLGTLYPEKKALELMKFMVISAHLPFENHHTYFNDNSHPNVIKVPWLNAKNSVDKIRDVYESNAGVKRIVWNSENIAIDGYVVALHDSSGKPVPHTPGHHGTNSNLIALKYTPEAKTTVIKHIDYSMGVKGSINPTVVVDPVELNGTMQGRITGSNFDNLIARGLTPGSVVAVSYNNDSIPYIQQVIAAGQPYQPPTRCPFCKSELILKMPGRLNSLSCVNNLCVELQSKRLYGFISAYDAHCSIGEASCEQLVRLGLRPYHLFCRKGFTRQWFDSSGLRSNTKTSLWKFINSYTIGVCVRDYDVVNALWFTNIGEKRSMMLCSLFDVKDLLSCITIGQLENHIGKSIDSTTKTILKWFYDPYDRSALQELKWIHDICVYNGVWLKTTNSSSRFSIAITGDIPGYNRSQLKHMCRNLGIAIDNVNRNTRYLVVGPGAGSTKKSRAEKYGIEIIDAGEFKRRFQLE